MKPGFVARFVVGCLVLGLAVNLGIDFVVRWRARGKLEQPIRPVRFENAALGAALQELADSAAAPIRLSLCPDLASSRVTLTTAGELPLGEFLVRLAGRSGAEVDLAHSRHGSFTEPFPHLYFARAPCGGRSFVYVVSPAR